MMDALNRAREYLRGIQADGYRHDHPITILSALVAEIDAAPVASIRHNEDGLPELEPGSYDDMRRIKAMEGKRVRLLVVGEGEGDGDGR